MSCNGAGCSAFCATLGHSCHTCGAGFGLRDPQKGAHSLVCSFAQNHHFQKQASNLKVSWRQLLVACRHGNSTKLVPWLLPRARPPKARSQSTWLGRCAGWKCTQCSPVCRRGATLHGQGQQLAAPGLRGCHAGRPSSPMPSPIMQKLHDFVVGRKNHRQSSRDKRWESAAGSNARRHSKATGRAALPTVGQNHGAGTCPSSVPARSSHGWSKLFCLSSHASTFGQSWDTLAQGNTGDQMSAPRGQPWYLATPSNYASPGRSPPRMSGCPFSAAPKTCWAALKNLKGTHKTCHALLKGQKRKAVPPGHSPPRMSGRPSAEAPIKHAGPPRSI